jgi:Ca-activated chloride channel family protein
VIKWGAPAYLWLLLVIPVGFVLLFLRRAFQRRALARVIDPHLIQAITPDYVSGLATLKQVLLLIGIALLLVAAARPRWGEKLQIYKGRGIDVVIALDASKSMLAEDVKPSRLVRAKTELSAFIDGLAGNAIGIVSFAGEAYVLCPLTTDADAAKMFLDIIDPGSIPVPGTDFGKAIDAANSLFNPKEASYKALVFVTDGDDLGKDTPEAISRAAEAGVRIFPVAFSTPEGAPVPDYDENGNLTAYKKDDKGQVVMSRMDERKLIVMAQATGGRFLRVEGFSADRLLDELDKMRKKDIGGGTVTDYVERYQWFLGLALLLILAGLSLSNRRGQWLLLPQRHRDVKTEEQAE